jgi:hypothetical protein
MSNVSVPLSLGTWPGAASHTGDGWPAGRPSKAQGVAVDPAVCQAFADRLSNIVLQTLSMLLQRCSSDAILTRLFRVRTVHNHGRKFVASPVFCNGVVMTGSEMWHVVPAGLPVLC